MKKESSKRKGRRRIKTGKDGNVNDHGWREEVGVRKERNGKEENRGKIGKRRRRGKVWNY
jgi:hypothetical protein